MADPKVILGFFVLLLLIHSTFLQLNSRVERAALLQLRSSLGLRSKEWPIKSDPCLIWAGIQCFNGRVIGINISGFKRTRLGSQNPQFSVEALANFSQLATFNAFGFALPGSIPEWFGQRLSALQVLDLRSCSIVGAILFILGNMTNLTALYLAFTGTIPSTLGQLLGLLVLDLGHNSLTGFIPLSFASLRNLTLLDMSSNFLSGSFPPGIGTISKLQFLNLSSNSLSSAIPAQLGDLSSLLAGSLFGNLFTRLTRLRIIDVNHNDFTGELLDILWSMPQLRFLDAEC